MNQLRAHASVCALFGLILPVTSGCTCDRRPDPGRNAEADVADPLGESVTRIVYLDQGWQPSESLRFYFTSQGSQMLPYRWFLALERADSETPFRDQKNMLKYRYLIQEPDEMNPDGLPVGFVRDQGDERGWLGLSCAACHTGQVDYNGVGYRIDGGPAMADVRGFLIGLTEALVATRDRGPKFRRFAAAVLGPAARPAERARLEEDLTRVIERREGYNTRNFPADAPPGYGRVDAFGAIVNEVFHEAVRTSGNTPMTANTEPADAPVSYPCLWDTPQHDFVQWNGVAENEGLGSLGRNVGEVLGVFGRFEIPERPGVSGYASTVRVRNLLAFEEWLTTLWSPLWPDDFPTIDPTSRDRGKLVYEKAKCGMCHAVIDRKDPNRRVEAVMAAVGTERRMADNFEKRTGQAGKLEGAYAKVIRWPPIEPKRLDATVGAEEILGHSVLGTIIASGFRPPDDELTTIEYRSMREDIAIVPRSIDPGGTYKARPLNGIWATAPYLHNGSVASLDQLLRPAGDRLKSFTVGCRQFDPEHVGFRTDAPGFPLFHARLDDGTPVPGNSNAGHEFGAELGVEERTQLIAYLKSL